MLDRLYVYSQDICLLFVVCVLISLLITFYLFVYFLLVYFSAFDSGSVASQGDASVISATFRTKSGGTVLQILSGNSGGAIRLSVSPSGKMEIEVCLLLR